MEDSAVPCLHDVEVEGFRSSLEASDAREQFYEPITHPFPPTETGELDVGTLKVEQLTGDIPTRVSPLGDSESMENRSAEPKRSISQEIIDVAYRTAIEATSRPIGSGRESSENSTIEIDINRNASTKSIFNSLIITPSRGSSRSGRRDSETITESAELPGVIEVPEEQVGSRDEPHDEPITSYKDRPRYYSNRATTLPAKLECKIFDPSKNAKLTRWELFKRKFYLGAANTRVTRAIEDNPLDADAPRASTAGPVDMESFCEVTNIEGLDLEGVPTMTQRSRKLFSWTRLKTGFTFKRKTGKGKNDDVPKGEPEEMDPKATEDDDDDEDECSQVDSTVDTCEDEEAGATSSKTKTEKEKGHTSWFEVFSHRLFTARRQRAVEDNPARPATAHTQQYYEIESNW